MGEGRSPRVSTMGGGWISAHQYDGEGGVRQIRMRKGSKPGWVDLAPYAGRWVAVVRGRVAGVGWTAEEALHAARRSRFKEEPQVIFVPAVEVPDDDGPLA
jgi:hypothetical protein